MCEKGYSYVDGSVGIVGESVGVWKSVQVSGKV